MSALEDLQPHDDGASLEGWDFFQDGFLDGARRAAAAAVTAAEQQQQGQGQGQGREQCQGQGGGPPQPLELTVDALPSPDRRRLAYRFRHLAGRYVAGLESMGTEKQRKQW